MQQEVAPLRQHDGGDWQGDQRRLGNVAPGHAEHVAEQDMIEVLVAVDLDEEHEAQREHAGEDDAHHRILLHPAVLLEIADAEGAGQSRCEGADGQWQARDMGEHDAGEHCMRDRIAHQRPALQHQETGQHGADEPDHHRDRKAAQHELVREGREQPGLKQAHAAPPTLATRRAPRRPCFGANRKAARKSNVWNTTISPPVEPSRK